jgi:hypothetical protein
VRRIKLSTREHVRAPGLPSLEVAEIRWSLAQELSVWDYPEQEDDAQILELWLGRLPE